MVFDMLTSLLNEARSFHTCPSVPTGYRHSVYCIADYGSLFKSRPATDEMNRFAAAFRELDVLYGEELLRIS